MKPRIYIVHKTLPVVNLPVLVKASSAAQATAYVAANLFSLRPATGLEIADLMGAGHEVMDAAMPQPPAPDNAAFAWSESSESPAPAADIGLPASKAVEEAQ